MNGLQTWRLASRLAAVVMLSAAAAPLIAQVMAPVVTSVSTRGAARWTLEDQNGLIELNMPLDGHVVEIAAEQSMMAYSSSGKAALIFQGPARFAIRVSGDTVDIGLQSGVVSAASETAPDEQVVQLIVPGDNDAPIVATRIGQGWTELRRDGAVIRITFKSDTAAAAALAVRVGDKSVNVPSGQSLTVTGGEASLAPSDAGGPAALGERLGVVSARTKRLTVQTDLFDNIIEWDRRAGTAVVIPTLEAQKFTPEIRQVAISTTPASPTTPIGSSLQQTPGIVGANEVPLISPAALSVAGVTPGLTAADLNAQARGLLTQTGSRGLGFNGLAQLAIPGFLNGLRTVGPPGLGAQR